MAVGEAAKASARTIRKYIHLDGIDSCEIAMGITTLEPGSVWNTMPCHIHDRRTEVYLYFDLPADERVVHLCGEPQSTRSLVLANRQAVISPPWSIHTGAGTASVQVRLVDRRREPRVGRHGPGGDAHTAMNATATDGSA